MPTDEVFLTGGSGFVGGHVLRQLLKAGYPVRALARDAGAGSRIASTPGWDARSRIVPGDVRKPGHLVRDLDGCRYVVHCAAEYAFGHSKHHDVRAINVEGTAGLLAAAHIAGVERAIVTSSSAALGPSPDGIPVDERSWALHDDRNGYHASKVAQERAAFAGRVPVVSLLPTAPIGPGDWKPTPTGRMIVDFARGKMFAMPPCGGMNVVPVEDVALAHVTALHAARTGERYILGGENMRLDDVWDLLAQVTGVPLPRLRVPSLVLAGAAHADEMRSRVSGTQPSIPLEGVRMASELMYADSTKARRELGFAPGSARAAAERAVVWFREHGYCP